MQKKNIQYSFDTLLWVKALITETDAAVFEMPPFSV